jgi:hypothetical protein
MCRGRVLNKPTLADDLPSRAAVDNPARVGGRRYGTSTAPIVHPLALRGIPR